MKFIDISVLLFGATVVVTQPQIAFGLTPLQINTIAKGFTVLVAGDGAGSGVVIERKGNTYYVLTNQHVVKSDGNYEIQTYDGARYSVKHVRELSGFDLAILEFNSVKNYNVATVADSDKAYEGMPVYVAGWAASIPGITEERNYQFTQGNIRSRLQTAENGYALVYDNRAIPGMSGGAVLDEQGNLIGINGIAREIEKQGKRLEILRFAIPINTFLAARNHAVWRNRAR
ncbi:TPR repeat-containing protein [Calothrix sp. NIES-4071]|nr:TPR repeat-containing protein [Calothrix sp. NIES-4071]BAZ56550.1 TPR repeat-containing protein [Calothrix sp. NIES-4105]